MASAVAAAAARCGRLLRLCGATRAPGTLGPPSLPGPAAGAVRDGCPPARALSATTPAPNFQIDVRDGNVEDALRMWKRQHIGSGMLTSLRKRTKFVKPSRKRFDAKNASAHRDITRRYGRIMGWIDKKRDNSF